jgi:TldD protein
MAMKYLGLLLCLIGLARPAQAQDTLMEIAEEELDRVWTLLSDRPEPVYWIGMGVTDYSSIQILATNGSVEQPQHRRRRFADIDLRVGSYGLDNTHPLRDAGWYNEDTHFATYLPIENDAMAIRTALWRSFDDAYRAGVRRLIKVRSNNAVKVAMEDMSPDFSPAEPVTDIMDVSQLSLESDEWALRLKDMSAVFLEYPAVMDSNVSLVAESELLYTLNTEGTRIRQQRIHYRLSVWATAVADDGMELQTFEYVDSMTEEGLPTDMEIRDMIHVASLNVMDLIEAPVVDPYVGPAILRGRAAAVFFHEILGHRVEGHRQKSDSEGKTLTDKVGKRIFPSLLSVADDPTMMQWAGQDLNGHYVYDDEGTLAQRVEIVEDGVLRDFLMSRSPIENFPETNGHGRREAGNAPVPRQGNLIITASESMSFPELKEQLIQQIRKQNKPFGLIFDDISGGFTFTGRTTPNSYSVQPVTVWKVYADGRPDELIRGVDMIGTPLITFSRIAAASDQYQVFNGACGAESGWVSVSAVAPDLLVYEVEVQRKNKGSDRPPLLQAPTGEE